MTIERLDLGQQLPRMDRRRLQEALRGGMGNVLDEIVTRWNETMQEIEDKLNEQLGQRINYMLDVVNVDVAYFGTRDQYGQWNNGSWKIAYDSTTATMQISRLESGTWTLKLTFATDGQINAVDLALSTPEDVYDLDHDSFAGFVAEEHIDHSEVSITAGDGLSGGGTIEATRTLTNSDKGSTAVGTHESTYDHSKIHDPATVADTTSIDLTITGQQISGVVLPAGVDHDSLDNVHQDVNTTASPEFAGLTVSGMDDLAVPYSATGGVLTGDADLLRLNDLGSGVYGLGIASTYGVMLSAERDGGACSAWFTAYRENVSGGTFGYRHARGSKASPTILGSGDYMMAIEAWGYGNTDFGKGAAINFVLDAAVTSGNVIPGSIRFQVGASTEVARCTSGGLFLVGKTSGTEKLEVAGKIRADTCFNVNGTDGVSGTLVLDDGTTERITLVFTGGILTSRTVAASSGLLMDWTD